MVAESASTAVHRPIAGVLRRFAAMVYDGFLLFGLLVVPLLITQALTAGSATPVEGVIHELPPVAPTWVIRTYAVLLTAAFYIYFWRTTGQTLGMQAWRMKVESLDGARPSWRQCLQRALVGPLSLFCAGLGYFWLWRHRRGTWHDRASGTRVIVLPKRAR